MERVEKSTIPHGLLRVSHLPNWITMSDVEKASREGEGEQTGVAGPLHSLICSSMSGLIFFFSLLSCDLIL